MNKSPVPIVCSEFIETNLSESKKFGSKKHYLKHYLNNLNIDGIICEFGVWKGWTINLMADLRKDDTIYGFDSFEGLPEDWVESRKEGYFKVNFDQLRFRPNIEIHKGWFKDTIPEFKKQIEDTPISLLSVDCDIYSSTKEILEGLNDNIVPGTLIHFDELINYEGWDEHEWKALREWLEEFNREIKYLGYVKYEVMVEVTK